MTENMNDAGWSRITIHNADEAWDLFQKAVQGGEIPDKLILRFDGWPTFEMKVDGKDWKSTVPTRVMAPLLELQKDLHRNYVSLAYGSANLKKLKDEDRDALEIVVKIGEGSSDFKAKLDEQLNALIGRIVDKMEARHLVITVLGIALAWGGTEVGKSWIATRQAAVEADKAVELSKQETERLKVFADATRNEPLLREVRKDQEQSTNRLLKSLKPNDSAQLKGVKLSGADAMQITQQERARAEDLHLSGAFRVLANDASRGQGFRIKVARVSDGLTFSADVPFELDYSQKLLIQKAEWSKGGVTVHLEIEASVLREVISGARVLSAREI